MCLERCPECNGKAEILQGPECEYSQQFSVGCTECDYFIEEIFTGYEAAERAWNKDAQDNKPQTRGEAMTKDLAVRDKGTLKALFDDPKMQESMREMLSKYITPERILKAALVAVSKNPKLFDCTKESWAMAFIKMAELGLDCSGTTGRGYLVPYWSNKLKAYEAQFIPGYAGFIDTAVREGLATYIECDVVYERDRFKFVRGTTPVFEHEPYLPKPSGTDGRGEIIAAYSLAHLANG